MNPDAKASRRRQRQKAIAALARSRKNIAKAEAALATAWKSRPQLSDPTIENLLRNAASNLDAAGQAVRNRHEHLVRKQEADW